MEGIEMKVEGTKLVLTIDLTRPGRPRLDRQDDADRHQRRRRLDRLCEAARRQGRGQRHGAEMKTLINVYSETLKRAVTANADPSITLERVTEAVKRRADDSGQSWLLSRVR